MERAQYSFVRTLRPVRPRSSGRIVTGRSPRLPRRCAPSTLSTRFRCLIWQQERRSFANYLSISDRYSAQTNFDSENTIGGRFRVNRAHERNAAFLPTVIKQQQWQIGDSLLNSKFGRLASDLARDLGNEPKLRD